MSSSSGFALFTIDLDSFKQINDTLGRATGDAVLVETAERLLATVRDTDLVCRTGGDEFIVINAASHDQAQDVAGRTIACQRAPIDPIPQSVSVSASVGGIWGAAKWSDFGDARC